MNTELLERIKGLCAIAQPDELEAAERLLDGHLKLYPHDTEAWLRLFMITIADYVSHEAKAIECCKKILAYDSYNIYALLALFYMYHYYPYYKYENSMVEKLLAFKSENYEFMSLIELTRAWYYDDSENIALKEKSLLKSIAYCDRFVCNYEALGYLYGRQDKFQEAILCLQKGLDNIQSIVYGIGEYKADTSDIESLLDEFFRGTIVSVTRRDSMQEALNYCNEMLQEVLEEMN